jgi:hypothetical protein
MKSLAKRGIGVPELADSINYTFQRVYQVINGEGFSYDLACAIIEKLDNEFTLEDLLAFKKPRKRPAKKAKNKNNRRHAGYHK